MSNKPTLLLSTFSPSLPSPTFQYLRPFSLTIFLCLFSFSFLSPLLPSPTPETQLVVWGALWAPPVGLGGARRQTRLVHFSRTKWMDLVIKIYLLQSYRSEDQNISVPVSWQFHWQISDKLPTLGDSGVNHLLTPPLPTPLSPFGCETQLASKCQFAPT